jgi:hypothetical protein
MTGIRLSLGVFGALALLGAAGAAQAQTARPAAAPSLADTAARESYQLNQSQQPRVLELDGKSHWGLKLEFKQPVTRDMQLKDVEAGAYYKLSPSVRLGGTVGVTDAKPATPQADANKAPVTPRAKIGATLKF